MLKVPFPGMGNNVKLELPVALVSEIDALVWLDTPPLPRSGGRRAACAAVRICAHAGPPSVSLCIHAVSSTESHVDRVERTGTCMTGIEAYCMRNNEINANSQT